MPPFEEGATAELERAVKRLGLKGLCLNTHCQGKYLDDDAYRPLYRKAAELDVPVVIHAAGAPAEYGFLRKYGLQRNFGRAIDHTLAVLKLLYSGILRDFPTLKFVNGHTGGTWWGLWERFLSPPGHFWRKEDLPTYDFRECLGQLHFDTAARLNPAELECATVSIGVDYLLLGSDYPAGPPNCLEKSVKLVQALKIPDADKEKVFAGNALNLFKVRD